MSADPAGIAAVLLQIPLVGAFIWFVLKQQERQHAANEKTHDDWRAWLDAREERLLEALRQIARRDDAQRDELVQLLQSQSQQLAYLTRLTLLIYTSMSTAVQTAVQPAGRPESGNLDPMSQIKQDKELTP
jgi:CBS-domain-containing membrane protein